MSFKIDITNIKRCHFLDNRYKKGSFFESQKLDNRYKKGSFFKS